VASQNLDRYSPLKTNYIDLGERGHNISANQLKSGDEQEEKKNINKKSGLLAHDSIY
jgi:hypothetical protein